jgi:hypothetical protein
MDSILAGDGPAATAGAGRVLADRQLPISTWKMAGVTDRDPLKEILLPGLSLPNVV